MSHIWTLLSCGLNIFSILSHLATNLDALLQPLGHGVGQLLHQADGQVRDPHTLDGGDEERQGRDAVVILKFFLHNRPQVLCGIQIERIPGPIQDFFVELHPEEELVL